MGGMKLMKGVEMTEVPKSCTTCQHMYSKGRFARCNVTGFYVGITRRYPDTGCDENYSAWVKRLSIKERFLFWLKGEIS